MSNTIDVLLVGGPANGRMVNMPRPGSTYIETLIGGEGVVRYTRRKWANPTSGKLYHIATRDEDAVTDEQVIVEVLFSHFPPAWDLN